MSDETRQKAPLEPYRFSLDRCLWPPDRDDVQCGKRTARAWGYFCADHETEVANGNA